MKSKTTNSQAGYPECVSKETAIAEAKKHRGLADSRRKQAQERLDGIGALIAKEKEVAALEFQYAADYDKLADAYLAHAESITSGKTDS